MLSTRSLKDTGAAEGALLLEEGVEDEAVLLEARWRACRNTKIWGTTPAMMSSNTYDQAKGEPDISTRPTRNISHDRHNAATATNMDATATTVDMAATGCYCCF